MLLAKDTHLISRHIGLTIKYMSSGLVTASDRTFKCFFVLAMVTTYLAQEMHACKPSAQHSLFKTISFSHWIFGELCLCHIDNAAVVALTIHSLFFLYILSDYHQNYTNSSLCMTVCIDFVSPSLSSIFDQLVEYDRVPF